jgi:hypothetical protein
MWRGYLWSSEKYKHHFEYGKDIEEDDRSPFLTKPTEQTPPYNFTGK